MLSRRVLGVFLVVGMFLSVCSFHGNYVAATVTNVGLDVLEAKVTGDGLVVFRVGESGHGNADLNGDGDSSDDVLHLFDSATGITTNLGLASTRFYKIVDDLLAFEVEESVQGNADLNGDGDSTDQVLHVFDVSTGITTNLGLAAILEMVSHGRVAFTVSEDHQGSTDLNGDGDAIDEVIHAYDSGTGTTINLGVAHPTGVVEPEAWIEGDYMAFGVFEDHQGGTDLNGDGDAIDRILYTYDFGTDTTTNMGLAFTQDPTCCSYEVADGFVYFKVHEDEQSADFNGDGDSLDEVAHLLEFSTGDITNTQLAGAPWVFGRWIPVFVSEADQGNTDLNGDGDTLDSIVHVYDMDTGVITSVGIAGTFGIAGDIFYLLANENEHGSTDFNGDGDADDRVLHLIDLTSFSTSNLGLCWSTAGFTFSVSEDIAAMGVSESDCGNTDYNGDGDALDAVVHVIDPVAGTYSNQGLAAYAVSVSDDAVYISVPEASQGNTDLNGDGDATDYIVYMYDPDTGTTTNTGLVSYFAIPMYGTIVLGAQEAEGGNTDLNGDGDSTDVVLHTYDTSADTTTNLGLAVSGLSTDYEFYLAFGVSEPDQGGTDLNGDGDALDVVLHFMEIEQPGETPGNTENPPPGQGGTPPGQGGTPPGLPDPPPGQGGENPGQNGCAPDCAPGQKKKDK